MKSLQLFFTLLFVGFIFCQVPVGNLYREMNTVRARHCLPGIRVNQQLEQAAAAAATAQCNGQSFRVPTGTYPFTSTFQSSAPATSTSAINNAISFYQTSLRSWTCTTDTGSGWSEFVRQSLVGVQEVGCAFSPLVCRGRNVYNLLCIFRTPAPPQGRFVVPRQRCTSCQGSTTTTTTTTGGTPTTTTTGGTPTTTGGTPTTTTGGTPTTTGGTPTTTGGTPSTTGGNTGNEVKDIHLQKINAARNCLGLSSVVWDDNLARRAQAYAERLAATCGGLQHASQAERGNEGENLWMVGGGTRTAAIQRGNDLWNAEAIDYNCGANTCAPGKACGHYTQNVWANTQTLGCGVAQCSRGYYGVCRYGPPGNYIGQHPFGEAKCSTFEQCKRGASAGRALSNSSPATATAQNPSTRFFESDSQIVVFALAIFIVVVVVAILVLVVVISKRRSTNKDLEYQLLETK